MSETKSPVILDRSSHPISRRDIDADALKVLYRLSRHGFKAYLVGGAVRDLLLDGRPKDFDIATDARPGQIKKLFSNCFLVGRRFRLAHIRFRGNKIIEVATFRKEPDQGPDAPVDIHNTFGTPEQDAFRRDITINALFYDIDTFSVIDHVGGLADISRKRVRVIGDPATRYTEDPVRMWRVLRHAARQGFSVEEASADAIRAHGQLIRDCPGARLYEELNKDLSSGRSSGTLSLLKEYGLLSMLLGELGARLEEDADLAGEFMRLMEAHDRMMDSGAPFDAPVAYSLLLWPLAEAKTGQDRIREITERFAQARMSVTIPKGIRAAAAHIILMVESMARALETGRLKQSLLKRQDYHRASTVFSIIHGIGTPGAPDPFLDAYRERFPARPAGGSGGRRRRRRRKRKAAAPDAPLRRHPLESMHA